MTNYIKHNRRTIRLKNADYSAPGFYFVTMCTKNRENLFGEIINSEMLANIIGHIVQQCWNEIPNHFEHVFVDEFVVMPNHIHGIIVIGDTRRGAIYRAPTMLGAIIGSFKAAVIRNIKQKNDEHIVIWQRNYFEHIIRNERALELVRRYVRENPQNWGTDVYGSETAQT